MRTNRPVVAPPVFTYEGGRATAHEPNLKKLNRIVVTCLLFENTFYRSGNAIHNEIVELCQKVSLADLYTLAIKARTDFKLRHVPLLLCREMARHPQATSDEARYSGIIASAIEQVIQRPDEMAEFLSLYWANGRCPLSSQVKKGLARAFNKFSVYQLAKWNRDNAIKLRDVMFLTHPRPRDEYQAKVWKQLVDDCLPIPETWETMLSAGKDKKATWEMLLREKKLGYIALLMNMRNMVNAGVSRPLIKSALMEGAVGSKALPFRFVSAAKHAPAFAAELSDAMIASLGDAERLLGSTLIVVDVSGSMNVPISDKGELTRLEAAAALAVLVREICDDARVFSFSDRLVEVKNVRGLPLIEAIQRSQTNGGTYLGQALDTLRANVKPTPDRVIVLTDEQSHDGTRAGFGTHNYLINVAPYSPALETSGSWDRISGFSERLVDFIHENERMDS
jgi:hypothetical protein